MRIFLVGFMGTGKTYWGNRWSLKNNIPFFDLDDMIEKNTGDTVANIFDKRGEQHFRDEEALALRSLKQYECCLVACGGGTPCYKDNMNWMNENGITIFLKSSTDFITNNVEKEQEKRPLLKNMDHHALLTFIEDKLKTRLPFYEQSRITVDSQELNDQSFENFISK